MTEQEAVQILNGIEEVYGNLPEDGNEVEETLIMAKEALEKQVPKIPDVEGDGYADGELVYDTWICPCCGTKYEVDYDEYDYCPNCGQHIERYWREEESKPYIVTDTLKKWSVEKLLELDVKEQEE